MLFPFKEPELFSLETGVPHERRWGVGGREVVVGGVKVRPVAVEVCHPAGTLAHRWSVAPLRRENAAWAKMGRGRRCGLEGGEGVPVTSCHV